MTKAGLMPSRLKRCQSVRAIAPPSPSTSACSTPRDRRLPSRPASPWASRSRSADRGPPPASTTCKSVTEMRPCTPRANHRACSGMAPGLHWPGGGRSRPLSVSRLPVFRSGVSLAAKTAKRRGEPQPGTAPCSSRIKDWPGGPDGLGSSRINETTWPATATSLR